MCGITGFFSLPNARPFFGSSKEAQAILGRMNSRLSHRGPDDEGYLIDEPLWMGMRRLKIIDLEGGRQPVTIQDGQISIIYNGEVYNYLELRKDLEARGHRFKTHSDTEVLVHSYQEEGLDFAKKLRGMFAFAIWDKPKGRLVLGRDPFGIKPLYWGIFNGWLLFASEIKALYECPVFKTDLDPGAVDDHLTLMYIPTPKSIYKGLFKLEPGHLLSIDTKGNRQTHCYWKGLPPEKSQLPASNAGLPAILEELDRKISQCVNISLRSDVPLGVFLSGGLDSAAVAYYAKKHKPDLKTYTVSFAQGSYDEGPDARLIAQSLGTDHTDIPMEYPQDLADFSAKVLASFDEPFGDISALPTYLLCREARRYLTVCLSGDGGDELFGGYPTFLASSMARHYSRLPRVIRAALPWLTSKLPTSFERVSWDYKLKRFAGQSAKFDDYRPMHFSWRGAFGWDERAHIYARDFWPAVASRAPFETVTRRFDEAAGAGVMDQLFYVDRTTYLLDEFLVKSDRMSMAHSLEVRPPLLDPQLCELASLIPARYKVRGLQTKWILRKLLEGKVPDKILKLPKKGFTPPLAMWFKEKSFQDFVFDTAGGGIFAREGMLRPGLTEQLLKEHGAGKADNTRKLWVILGLALFKKRHDQHVQTKISI